MRINGLSPNVRNYLALSEALTFEVNQDMREELDEIRLLTLGSFKDEHRKELGDFISFRDGLGKPKKKQTPNSYLIEGKTYTLAAHSYPPEDKTDTHVLLIREPDRLVEHDRYVRKSDLLTNP